MKRSSRIKIFAAAVIIMTFSSAAFAEISGGVDGNVIKKFHFNADTGVTVQKDGTVMTDTAISEPGTLSQSLQTEAMWAENDQTMTDQRMPPDNGPAVSASSLGSSVRILQQSR